MIDAERLAKFNRRAKTMKSQAHVDAAMRTFPQEHHDEIAGAIQDNLRAGLIARKVEPVEIVIKDPENPTLHESTVERLNKQAETIEEMKAAQKPFLDRIAELEGQKAEHETMIASLVDQRRELLGKISMDGPDV